MSDPIENDIKTKKSAPGGDGSETADGVKTPLTRGGKWVVAGLGVYLLIFMILSLCWFAGLMFADTNAPENADLSLRVCIAGMLEPTPTPSPNQNTNANTANTNKGNANYNGNTALPTGNLNGSGNYETTGNTNTPVNANRPSNSNSPGAGAASPAKTPPAGRAEGNKADDDEAFNLRITRVVTIDKDGYFGSLLSVYTFTKNGCITADGYLFLVVLFAGMIGAIIRAVIYLTWRVGDGEFSLSWAWYYLFQPFLGAGMALIVYVVIRGGFNGGAIGKGNIYAFAAVAFLTALFSDNAMAKLKLIAESLLVKVDPRAKPDPDAPKKGAAGGNAGGKKPGDNKPATRTADGDDSSADRTPGTMARDEPPV